MADFDIQRGTATIASSATSVTITASTDYDAPSSTSAAFIRITGVQSTASSQQSGDFGGQPQNNTAYISNPSNLLTSITFTRNNAHSGALELSWEIIEYTGAASGANEFIVRHLEVLDVDDPDLTADSSSVSGVSDEDDVVPFLTSMSVSSSSYGRGEHDNYLCTLSYIHASTLVRATREATLTTRNARLSLAVVEFTGSNWSVSSVTHSYSAADTTETETISISDTAKAFLHTQIRTDQTVDGANATHDTWISSTSQLSTVIHELDGTSDLSAWIIENTQSGGTEMDVQSITGTRSDGTGSDPDTFTDSITSVSSLDTSSIMSECGGGTTSNIQDLTAHLMSMRLTATDTVTLTRGRNRADRVYRFDVVEWPTVAAGGGYTYRGLSLIGVGA